MKLSVRNEPDSGPAADGAVVTYSRLSAPAGPEPAQRQEPYLDAREVPYRDPELRAYDPDRAADTGLDGAIDDLAAPRRGGKRPRGGFGAIVVGALALAVGMVILAYAYGIATRVDGPPVTAGATATAPDGGAAMRTTLPADDAARSTSVTGDAPAAALSPAPGAVVPDKDTSAARPALDKPAARAEPPTPQAAPREAARAPAAEPSAAGSDGVPMDGDFALPSAVGGAPPALVAPVPATAAPAAPTEPTPPAKAASAPPADAGTGGGDDLMANIERLLARDAANGGTAQPDAAQPMGPTPLDPAQPTMLSDPNALPQLPEPNAATAIVPPADVGPQPPNRLIPPADIPDAPPTGDLGSGLR